MTEKLSKFTCIRFTSIILWAKGPWSPGFLTPNYPVTTLGYPSSILKLSRNYPLHCLQTTPWTGWKQIKIKDNLLSRHAHRFVFPDCWGPDTWIEYLGPNIRILRELLLICSIYKVWTPPSRSIYQNCLSDMFVLFLEVPLVVLGFSKEFRVWLSQYMIWFLSMLILQG